MPDLTGFDVARALREESWARRALFIALTGWGSAEDKEAARVAGFDVHLTKPVDTHRLIDLVSTHPGADAGGAGPPPRDFEAGAP